jgi:hypothetical protein
VARGIIAGMMSASRFRLDFAIAVRCALILGLLGCAACVTTGGASDEAEEPTLTAEEHAPQKDTEAPDSAETPESTEEEGEVPLAVAESEHREQSAADSELAEVIVQARARHEVIHDLVSEAQALLSDVELRYAFTGKGKREVLRGRPVAFALWSEAKEEWTIAHIEIPRPPVKWKPGGKPMPFTMLTPGIQARHVKGTGAERLMFAFSSGDDQLKVYGRKYPVFDSALLKKKQWRAVAQTARPIVYLPYTEDTFDPLFVSNGKDFLLATARQAIGELRSAAVPSAAFSGELLADVVPAEVITTLAVIEQTDDADYVAKQKDAVNEVLSQYGLKREEAYRYSVSKAAAIGPMQFTNKRGKGTYAMVVRRCPGARLDPNFERGATNILNAMKGAICLLDIELSQMKSDIQEAYRANPAVLGIFPVAAYNGGPRNVAKLYRVLDRTGVQLDSLSRPGEQIEGSPVTCPCIWKQDATGVRPVSIPKYNNENRWYIEKYQNILGLFE